MLKYDNPVKNLDYPDRDVTIRDLSEYQQQVGGLGLIHMGVKHMQRKYGVQAVVSKQVSDDLQFTDLDRSLDLENIPWLAESVEFYFEDPNLPTILVCYQALEAWEKEWNTTIAAHPDQPKHEKMLRIYCESASKNHTHENGKPMREASVVYLSADLIDKFFKDEDDLDAGDRSEYALEPDPKRTAMLREVCLLAVKVMYFCSQIAPQDATKNQLKHGGKAGVRGRPNRPIKRVVYLPRVAEEQQREAIELGGKHEFNGRRGTLRHLVSERYTKMKGKTIYVPPIRDPKTGEYPTKQRKYKIRQPKT